MPDTIARCVTIVFLVCLTAFVPILVMHTDSSTEQIDTEQLTSPHPAAVLVADHSAQQEQGDFDDEAFVDSLSARPWHFTLMLYGLFGWTCLLIGFLFYYYGKKYRRRVDFVVWQDEAIQE